MAVAIIPRLFNHLNSAEFGFNVYTILAVLKTAT